MADKKIARSNWSSSFTLIGKAVITDTSLKLENSNDHWVWNSLSFGVDCGEKYGTTFVSAMGGHSPSEESVIYAHGKNEDGTDDYATSIQVDFSDRFNPDVLEDIGNSCFVRVGLERTENGKLIAKRFLSMYDAIPYIAEHLHVNDVVRVSGHIRYSIYNDSVQISRELTNIALSSVEEDKFISSFRQTILLDKDSVDLKNNLDKKTGELFVNATVLDYANSINGVDIKGHYPFHTQFEYVFPDIHNEKQTKGILNSLFKVKKGYTQITFNGEFVNKGSVVQATWDDVPDDVKSLVDCGIYTKEDALASCTARGKIEHKMILKTPVISRPTEANPVAEIMKFEERYDEDDLDMSSYFEHDDSVPEEFINTPSDSADDSMDWLNEGFK